MKSIGLKYFTDINLTNIGLIVFVLIFLCVIAWVYRKGSAQLYHKISTFPLNDEEVHGQ